MPSEFNEQDGAGNEDNRNDASSGVGPDDSWILAVVDGLIPKFGVNGSASTMETGVGAGSDAQEPNQPSKLPETSRLDPKFVVENARRAREEAEANEDHHRAEKRLRGIAGKQALAEHCDKLSRGIQSFVKFFLGNPDKPQDYPPAPTREEIKAQYWVDQRTASIKRELDRLRQRLQGKTPAELDYFVSLAEKEIRKNIQLPSFIPAAQKGNHKGQPVSSQTKGDVERALALAGISRLTFEWEISHGVVSTWNSTILEVLGGKSVEWLRRSMPVTDEQAAQAPAIIQRWIRENRCTMVNKVFQKNVQLAHIVENKDCGSDIEDGELNMLPVRMCPNWRSGDLTSVLHCLDKMVKAQVQHHKTIETNEKIYGRSKTIFKTFKGARGVPRDLPQDCYDDAWWEKLSPFERETISTVKSFGLKDITKNLETHCHGTTITSDSNAASRSPTQTKNKRQLEDDSGNAGPSTTSGEGSGENGGRGMNVD
ncbi:hypothetical protein PTTG_29599 [Puccinia triticina 1-1 BBBD Race 1]|uniref:Uncharacterized protein n=1 Tax=Puccinia triticina (isolate 1-1 / race 1 (BBBD)) TaxID=630390 RepID=A0A180G3L6_PUCT1|nr:hypothetical protein PTTG_29599 [Puccinia triticina 1-1 BBBD Race 1]